jgi:lipid-A-disaccharide synthase-like uncharacterized protein
MSQKADYLENKEKLFGKKPLLGSIMKLLNGKQKNDELAIICQASCCYLAIRIIAVSFNNRPLKIC